MQLDGQYEHQLTQRLLKKESSAWKEVYTLYSGNMTAIGCRYITNRDDLRDVLQNSFVNMFTNIQKFEYRGKGALRAWMSRIVVNEALQFLRKNANICETNETDWENLASDILDDEPPFDHLSSKEILTYIQKLPVGYRTVFNLYVFEEKSHQEIAQLLGISEGTSASQLSRAKKVLASEIKKYQLSKSSVL